jgi:hypothetical protein
MKENYLLLKRFLDAKLDKISLNFERFLLKKIDFSKKII